MTSTESTEPKGSDGSSTNPRCGSGDCGHLRSSHFNQGEDIAYCIDNRNWCRCTAFQLPMEQKNCDHSTCGWKPRYYGPDGECLHPKEKVYNSGGNDAVRPRTRTYWCGVCESSWTEALEEPPPLAPEEETCNACGHSEGEGCGCPAHAFVSKTHCHRCEGTWLIKNAMVEDAEPPPPQPLRRPPYAVAYSVAGHLYEIALPGDATVHATDGGLIITHTLGPVAGVVRVHPIEGEQS